MDKGEMLLEELSAHIKSVQIQHVLKNENKQFKGYTEADKSIRCLLQCIEKIILCGLRNKQHGYWKVVRQFCQRDVYQSIEQLQTVKTEIGKGRAWLYMVLNENLLESFLVTIQHNNNQMQNFYNSYSILSSNKIQLFINLILGLEFISFKLSLDVGYLDYSIIPESPHPQMQPPQKLLLSVPQTQSHNLGSSVYISTDGITQAAKNGREKAAQVVQSFFHTTTSPTSPRLPQPGGEMPLQTIYDYTTVKTNTLFRNPVPLTPDAKPSTSLSGFESESSSTPMFQFGDTFERNAPRHNPFNDIVDEEPCSGIPLHYVASGSCRHDIALPITDHPIEVVHQRKRKHSEAKRKTKSSPPKMTSQGTQCDEIKLTRKFCSETDSGLMSDCEDDQCSLDSIISPSFPMQNSTSTQSVGCDVSLADFSQAVELAEVMSDLQNNEQSVSPYKLTQSVPTNCTGDLICFETVTATPTVQRTQPKQIEDTVKDVAYSTGNLGHSQTKENCEKPTFKSLVDISSPIIDQEVDSVVQNILDRVVQNNLRIPPILVPNPNKVCIEECMSAESQDQSLTSNPNESLVSATTSQAINESVNNFVKQHLKNLKSECNTSEKVDSVSDDLDSIGKLSVSADCESAENLSNASDEEFCIYKTQSLSSSLVSVNSDEITSNQNVLRKDNDGNDLGEDLSTSDQQFDINVSGLTDNVLGSLEISSPVKSSLPGVITIDNSLRLQMMIDVVNDETETLIELIQVSTSQGIHCGALFVLFTDKFVYFLETDQDMFEKKKHLDYDTVSVDYLCHKQGVVFLSTQTHKCLQRCDTCDKSISDTIVQIFLHSQKLHLPSQGCEGSAPYNKHVSALQQCVLVETGVSNSDIKTYCIIQWSENHNSSMQNENLPKGILSHKSGKTLLRRDRWIPSYYIVENKTLYQFKDKKAVQPQKSWPLSEMLHCQLTGHDAKTLEILSNDGKVELRASSSCDARTWVLALQALIMEQNTDTDALLPYSLLLAEDQIFIIGEDPDTMFCRCLASSPLAEICNITLVPGTMNCQLRSKCTKCRQGVVSTCTCVNWTMHFRSEEQRKTVVAHCAEKCNF